MTEFVILLISDTRNETNLSFSRARERDLANENKQTLLFGHTRKRRKRKEREKQNKMENHIKLQTKTGSEGISGDLEDFLSLFQVEISCRLGCLIIPRTLHFLGSLLSFEN